MILPGPSKQAMSRYSWSGLRGRHRWRASGARCRTGPTSLAVSHRLLPKYRDTDLWTHCAIRRDQSRAQGSKASSLVLWKYRTSPPIILVLKPLTSSAS